MYFDKKKFLIANALLLLIVGSWHFYEPASSKARQLASVDDNNEKSVTPTRTIRKSKQSNQFNKNIKKPRQSKSILKEDLTVISEELFNIKKCYLTESCPYPNTDPKAYHFAVSLDLKAKLFSFHNKVLKNRLVDPTIGKLAREFLAVEDGHVKEVALHLLSTQEISESSLESLIRDVLSFHDAKLIPHAMLELQRYLNSVYESRVHTALAQAIQNGAPSVSESVTQNIRPFLNTNSLEVYQNSLKGISKKTNSYKKLKLAVEDFRKSLNAA